MNGFRVRNGSIDTKNKDFVTLNNICFAKMHYFCI